MCRVLRSAFACSAAALLAASLAGCAGPAAHEHHADPALTAGRPAPAEAAFERLAALQGEWIDADGTFGGKGQVAVTYRTIGGGSAVVETLFAGTPDEMLTVYHLDGDDLVLTHYCSGGNQPRMRAEHLSGDVVEFDYVGGTNVDPAVDDHMHSGRIEFVSADEIRGEWQGWSGGRPAPGHLARFHLVRRQG